MEKLTIKDVVVKVLETEKRPMLLKEILDRIIETNSYQFKSENPGNILSATIRRHCKGFNQSNERDIFFQKLDDNTYWLNNISIPS